MATITTKYSIGDAVYRAGTVIEQKSHPCPDCLGTREWKAISPAGREYAFTCPRCSTSFQSDRDLSLKYSAHVPSVIKLTIGSVRTDSHSQDRPVEYMCRETGVGSGSIYDEATLFPTEQEALAASEVMAKERDQSSDWIEKLYDKTLSLSDYQLSDAVKKAAEDRDRERRYKVEYLFEDLRECESVEDFQRVMTAFSEKEAA